MIKEPGAAAKITKSSRLDALPPGRRYR